MKKILILATCFALSFTSVKAQEEEDALKQFQFGFSAGLAMKFLDTDFTNYLDKPGMGAGFNGGVVFNYHFNDRVALSSGVLFDLESFRTEYSVNDEDAEIGPFYAYKDKDIRKFKNIEDSDNIFFLQSRKNSLNYLSIPINIRLQTNKIGFFRYFGKVGVKADFLLQRRVTDTGNEFNFGEIDSTGVASLEDFKSFKGSEETMEKMNSTGHFQFMRASFSAAFGAEWFFSGTTALTMELEYNYGFTNIYKGSSNSVFYYESLNDLNGENALPPFGEDAHNDDNRDYTPLNVKANMHQFLIKVGIMF